MEACREWAGSHTTRNTGLSIKQPFDTGGRSRALTVQLQPFRFAPNARHSQVSDNFLKVDAMLERVVWRRLERKPKFAAYKLWGFRNAKTRLRSNVNPMRK